MRAMKEAFALTGYVPATVAERLAGVKAAGGEAQSVIEVAPERGVSDVVMRVRREDVAEIRLGASENGATLVQLILRDDAHVETVLRQPAGATGLTRLDDPALQRLTASATAKQILI